MSHQALHPEPGRTRRVELILHQLDDLPTLNAIAVRLLELTTDDTAEASEIVELISSDPTLSSRVLRLCRCNERGRAADVQTVERAVLLLGFDAVRSAVLSVQVFSAFQNLKSPAGEVRSERPAFEPELFWQHSVAVATACEMIVRKSSLRHQINASEAFIAGLLHDLGQIVLHVLMPNSFDRVCELAEAHGISVDAACTQLIGIDTHTAGKRLAEHWSLPAQLGDTMWLHGQPFVSLPDLPYRTLIGVVGLADAVVRRQHIVPLGHRPRNENIHEMCAQLGVDEAILDEIMGVLHEEISRRAEGFGLDMERGSELLLRSISRANEVLGRINATLQVRANASRRLTKTLDAIADFHAAAAPGGTVVNVLGRVVRSAADTIGGTFFATLYQSRTNEPWQCFRFSDDGRLLNSAMIPSPAGALPESGTISEMQLSAEIMGMLPELQERVGEVVDMGSLRLLPLECGWGVNAVLLHNAQVGVHEGREQIQALSRTWGAAVAAAAQHEDAEELTEQLAKSNRDLMEAQNSLAQSQTLASLGEIAAGAAHEMNNPLTVISGRSQLLVNRLLDPDLRSMAEQVVQNAHRLSDIITALRMFAEPSQPTRRQINMGDLVMRVVQDVRPGNIRKVDVHTVLASDVPPVFIDPEQIACALGELVRNAIESEGSSHIEVRVQIDPFDNRLKLRVTDNGSGLSPTVLAHAFDPFFSAKPAGRQPGLGLAQARRIVEAHGGQITLENRQGGGAAATIWLPDWAEPDEDGSLAEVA
ncbi:MAG: HDOD domain-containing protein [Planctomycetota bacterium]